MTKSALPNMNTDTWVQRSGHEVGFWDGWVRTKGGKWPDDYKRRTDPTTPLSPVLQSFLNELDVDPSTPASILDIGSGPLSICGYACPGREIELTMIDPLAEQYNRALDANGVSGVPRPVTGYFETALDQMGPNRFDIVWCRNSLDHSIDPLLGLYSLISMCKIGGGLYLSFHPNEAQKENYQGLHQWNLDEWNGNLIVSQKGHHINLGRIIEQQKLMSISRAPDVEGDKGEITVKLQKLRDCNLTQSLMIQTRS